MNLKFLALALAASSLLNAKNNAALLFHGNCTTCHFETKSASAPSVVDFRKAYLNAFAKKEDFISYMSTWILDPNVETSIMRGAVEKYELMPELGFDRSTLDIISAYVYDTDFSKKHEDCKE